MSPQKRGRTTRLTNNGRVFSVNGTFTINYRNSTRLGRIGNTFLIRHGTPFTLACDINAVFGAMNLSTICTCVVRAILRSVSGAQGIADAAAQRFVRSKERQLRSMRRRVVRATSFGKAFGLAVRAVEPQLTAIGLAGEAAQGKSVDDLLRKGVFKRKQ